MNTALVLGITGGFGGHVADELLRRGWNIKALMRDASKLPPRFRGIDVVTGDASRIDDVRRAAGGADVIVYGVNAPYPVWNSTVVPWLDVTARVAEERQLTIVFPGNVYVFDPAAGPDFNEHARIHPVTEKGRLRATMEQRLRAASAIGARVIVIRCGDFIGRHAPSAWLNHLIKPTRRGFALSVTSPRTLTHTWAYLPDVARDVAALLARRDALDPFAVFHFQGYRVTFNEIATAIQSATGQPVSLKSFPWWVLKIAAPFSGWLRSLCEMRYLWNHEINLDERLLARTLGGAIARTPLSTALVEAGLVAPRAPGKTIPAADSAA